MQNDVGAESSELSRVDMMSGEYELGDAEDDMDEWARTYWSVGFEDEKKLSVPAAIQTAVLAQPDAQISAQLPYLEHSAALDLPSQEPSYGCHFASSLMFPLTSDDLSSWDSLPLAFDMTQLTAPISPTLSRSSSSIITEISPAADGIPNNGALESASGALCDFESPSGGASCPGSARTPQFRRLAYEPSSVAALRPPAGASLPSPYPEHCASIAAAPQLSTSSVTDPAVLAFPFSSMGLHSPHPASAHSHLSPPAPPVPLVLPPQALAASSAASKAVPHLIYSHTLSSPFAHSSALAPHSQTDAPQSKKARVKRPQNAFLCFSNTFRQQLRNMHRHLTNADVSRILGERWKALPQHEKNKYVEQARRIKDDFKEKHPDYVYTKKRKSKPNATHQLQMSNLFSMSYGMPLALPLAVPPSPGADTEGRIFMRSEDARFAALERLLGTAAAVSPRSANLPVKQENEPSTPTTPTAIWQLQQPQQGSPAPPVPAPDSPMLVRLSCVTPPPAAPAASGVAGSPRQSMQPGAACSPPLSRASSRLQQLSNRIPSIDVAVAAESQAIASSPRRQLQLQQQQQLWAFSPKSPHHPAPSLSDSDAPLRSPKMARFSPAGPQPPQPFPLPPGTTLRQPVAVLCGESPPFTPMNPANAPLLLSPGTRAQFAGMMDSVMLVHLDPHNKLNPQPVSLTFVPAQLTNTSTTLHRTQPSNAAF